MGMSMPEVLETTCEYLDQVTKIADGGLEVPDSLALKVDAAAKEARAELEGRSLIAIPRLAANFCLL